MNLAWLAAVLEPLDIAPHPNFPDDAYDSIGPARLAAVVLGDPARSHRTAELAGELDDDDPVTLAEQSLRFDTMATSIAALAGQLISRQPEDLAEAAALTLVVCSAAAELDEYVVCFQVLDAQLRWTSGTQGPDGMLLRAALLQQKALRLRDAGRPYLSTTKETAATLSHLDTERCSMFATSPGVSWSSRTTLKHIRDSLVDAAASLIPIDQTDVAEGAGLPTWQERIRGEAPSVATNTMRSRAETYAEYVEQVFAREFETGNQSVGDRGRPDLFYSALALELSGHIGVYSARKELALLRLVQSGGRPLEMADALRSLRHAAAKNELDLALSRLRAAGPLSVLSDDARQILRTRTAPEMLRTVEMRVLRVAADLLAPAEARAALTAVRAVLTAGGPADLPGQWELPVLRKEVAWTAAAALGNAGSATGEVAQLLLDEADKVQKDDQLLDRALLHAVAEIDWASVPQDLQNSWLELLSSKDTRLPGTAEMLFTRLGRSEPETVTSSAMDVVIHRLNTVIRGGPIDTALARDGVPLTREAMTKIRSDAARGTFSFGGLNIADIAAGLIIFVGQNQLWSELTDFLLDPAVSRIDRTPAFERLARNRLSIPEAVQARFREESQQLLVSARPEPFEPSISPYPAALRFLGAHRLIDDAELYDEISVLAGSADARGRREAAATVTVLSVIAPRGDLLALALPLARDNDVEVRANAARALAILARPDQALATVSRRRLQELLLEDGLLVPLQVLRALADLPGGLPNSVRSKVEEIATLHPARSVRAQAGRLLEQPPEQQHLDS